MFKNILSKVLCVCVCVCVSVSVSVSVSVMVCVFMCVLGGMQQDSSSFQSLSYVQFFATPWTAARQASLSVTNSQSLLKRMSIELVMPSNYLILCHPLLLLPSIFPSIKVFFSVSQFFTPGGQSIGASASASFLPMNIQD